MLDVSHDGATALVRVGGRGRRTVLRGQPAQRRRCATSSPRAVRPPAKGVTDQGAFLPDGQVLVRSNLRRDRYALMRLRTPKASNSKGFPEVVAVHAGGELDSFAVTDVRRMGSTAVERAGGLGARGDAPAVGSPAQRGRLP